MTMFHYTCVHAANRILGMQTPAVVPAAVLHPHRFPTELGKAIGGVAWFTNLDKPMRAALGLSSQTLSCDRTQYRFRVVEEDEKLLTRWFLYRRRHPAQIWEILEASEGAMPSHWWIATEPVRVVES